ncbi:MFS transporter [Sulfurospirillum multivorans]|uniref:Major facilitator family protein n=2 Tax=Sulfurospirillum multivorans TaxID=66821 RepID=A0AA86DYI7_SULMK|nr:MFS transporter [Sulfurospirillum multivorans]AHJ11445.1 major facilitator family protein [Sulfurospirillum multivorans DSM 12446]QEH04949.1 major facilitator family protein [Sulfurospirillum multivorans]
MNQYVELLRNNTTLRRLSIIQLISYFGAWFSHMGIYTLLIQLDAPVWALSAAAGFTFLPSMLLAPFSGAIIDKVDTKKFMLFLTAIEIVTVFWLMFITSLDALWILLGLIFIRMGTGSIYFQTEMSLLPKLLNNDELKLANEIHSMIWSISYAFGMAVAGFYIHYFGTTSAFIADMVLYCISFYLLLGLDIPSIASQHALHVKAMIWSGFVYIKENPKIMHLIFLHASVGLTAYDALIALLADHQYKQFLSIALVMGFINASRALSQVLGQFLLSRYITKETLFYIFIVQGIGIILWGVLQYDFYLSFIGIFVCGLFTTSLWSYTYTLLQYETDEAFYGRVIAYNDMVFMGMCTLVSFAIGILFEWGLSLSLITGGLGFFFIVFGFYWKWVQKVIK